MCIISNASVNSNLSYSLETLSPGRNWWHFVPGDLEIWWMTFENDGITLLYYTKLCASFRIHPPFQIYLMLPQKQLQGSLPQSSKINLSLYGWAIIYLQDNTMLCHHYNLGQNIKYLWWVVYLLLISHNKVTRRAIRIFFDFMIT